VERGAPQVDGVRLGEAGGVPPVTVVMNLYDEEARVARLLAMLEAQGIDGLRVIVVDDGSTDRTREVVAAYRGPLRVTLLPLPHVGLAPARQVGLDAVEEGIAVVVDADMTFPPGWLRAMAALFAADPRLGGAASRVAGSGSAWVARGGQAVREVLAWVRSRSRRPWMVGHGMAVRAEAYRGLGFVADRLTAEDLELSARLVAAGWRIAVLEEPPITTVDPATLAGVWRRHLLVGRRTVPLAARDRRFLLRVSNLGRFFPLFLVGASVVDRRLGMGVAAAMTGVLVAVMRRRGVPWRDVPAGVVVFAVQTSAATAGFLGELAASGRRARRAR